jgi:hypothetical protein
MKEHLQNLVSQGYMTAAELATYRVPDDPASPPWQWDMSWHAQRSMNEDLCAITLISLFPTAVLQLGAASPDSFGDPAYCGLRDPVRDLHGD